ncbi:hypothetical protein Q1695_003100 [Nippostrongylus brasiliensis]|nr:hypothetical protein Q1695_003100 [Nippostrongylus brasiliensis]
MVPLAMMRLYLVLIAFIITDNAQLPYQYKSVRQQERELRYQECLEICVDTAIVDSQIACNECILPIDPYNVFGTW